MSTTGSFWLIEQPGIGWLSGIECGHHTWTRAAEQAISFTDSRSADVAMQMMHCGYGVKVSEHIWCGATVNQQASEPDGAKESGVREALARLVETLARIEKLAELHTPVYEGYPTTVLKSPGKCYAAMEAIGEAARSALAFHSADESAAVAAAVRRPDGGTDAD